jgi:hypothetical protein
VTRRTITAYEIGEQSAHKLQRPFGSALKGHVIEPLPRITVKPVRPRVLLRLALEKGAK